VFAFKEIPHLSQQAGKGAVRPAWSAVKEVVRSLAIVHSEASPVDLLVNVIEVIRVIGVITITRVIRVGLPIRDGLVRLASWRFGRSDAVALEVAPTEDAHGELLAGGISHEVQAVISFTRAAPLIKDSSAEAESAD